MQGRMRVSKTKAMSTSPEWWGMPLVLQWTRYLPMSRQVLCWNRVSAGNSSSCGQTSERGWETAYSPPPQQLLLGLGLQLALIKTAPMAHLGSSPTAPLCGAALLVHSPKSILTLKTAELHFLCTVLVKACWRVRGP